MRVMPNKLNPASWIVVPVWANLLKNSIHYICWGQVFPQPVRGLIKKERRT